jgi:hypothetical protein
MGMCLDLFWVFTFFAALLIMQFRWVLCLAALLWACGCLAGTPDDLRAALDQNFAAYNAEDAAALTATLSPDLPGLPEFQREAARLFEETDSYISVREFEVLAVRGNVAKTRVVQHTVTGDSESSGYRQHSMLMPKYPTVEYVQYFKKVRGKWKLGLVEEEPRRVEDTPNIAQASQPAGRSVFGNCANGTCPQR